MIKIRGKDNSFNSVFNLVRKPHKNIAAIQTLEKLIRVRVIEKVYVEYIKFITALPNKAGFNDLDDAIRVLADTMNRLCRTILHNKT